MKVAGSYAKSVTRLPVHGLNGVTVRLDLWKWPVRREKLGHKSPIFCLSLEQGGLPWCLGARLDAHLTLSSLFTVRYDEIYSFFYPFLPLQTRLLVISVLRYL